MRERQPGGVQRLAAERNRIAAARTAPAVAAIADQRMAAQLGLDLMLFAFTAVWLATLRAWTRDDTADLGATMAALDRALDRAEQVARALRLEPGDTTAGPDASML